MFLDPILLTPKDVSFLVKIKRFWAAKIYKQSAGAIIFYKKDRKSPPQFLLIERGSPINDWIFPKGGIKPGEDSKKAAVREVFEEAGLKVKILNLLGAGKYTYYWDKDNQKVTKKVDYFLAKVNSKRAHLNLIRQGSEAKLFKQIKWFSGHQALSMVKHLQEEKILEKAINLINN